MSESIIALDGLEKRYGSIRALEGLTLSLSPGPIGLLGPNGAGKSTLIKLLLGQLEPSAGKARIAGFDPTRRSERLALRRKVGYMPESDCLIPRMNGVELVTALGRLTGLSGRDAITRAHEVLDYVGLEEARYRGLDEYSTGMKQRLKLAQALVHDPDLLLLDEPTNGLDPKGRRHMLELIHDLGHAQRKSLLLCSHLLPDVERTCDSVVVIDKGRILSSGTIEELTRTEGSWMRAEVDGDVAAFRAQLAASGLEFEVDGPCSQRVRLKETDGDGLFELATRAGATLIELAVERSTLEDVFMGALQDSENSAAVPTADGVKEKRGESLMAETHLEVYRRFEGKLEERRLRFWPIWISGLQTALKQRRALLLLYAPPAIATVIFSFVVYLSFSIQQELERPEPFDGELTAQLAQQAAITVVNQGLKMLEVTNQIIEFNKAMGFFALLAVAWLASGLFCEDRKAGAHQLYFSRPITRLDYFLGKFSIAAFFALCAMLVPLLVICIVAAVSSPEWSFLKEQWDVFPRAVAFCLVWTTIVVSLVLLASSLAGRRSFALIGVIGFFVLSEAFGNALGELVDKRFLALSLTRDLNALSSSLFGREDSWTEVTKGDMWLFVSGLTLFAWLVIAARLRRLEVVA